MLLVLALALLIFGGKRIPEIAKGLGEGIRNFKDSLHGEEPKKPQ
jgi:sec-independent protein translocase protein TatA